MEYTTFYLDDCASTVSHIVTTYNNNSANTLAIE